MRSWIDGTYEWMGKTLTRRSGWQETYGKQDIREDSIWARNRHTPEEDSGDVANKTTDAVCVVYFCQFPQQADIANV